MTQPQSGPTTNIRNEGVCQRCSHSFFRLSELKRWRNMEWLLWRNLTSLQCLNSEESQSGVSTYTHCIYHQNCARNLLPHHRTVLQNKHLKSRWSQAYQKPNQSAPPFYFQRVSKQYPLSVACKIQWESSDYQWIGHIPTCYPAQLVCLWTSIYLPMGQVTHWCCARSSNQTRATLKWSQSQSVQRYHLPKRNQDNKVPVSKHVTKN